MKKMIATLLTMSMVLSLAACSDTGSSKKNRKKVKNGFLDKMTSSETEDSGSRTEKDPTPTDTEPDPTDSTPTPTPTTAPKSGPSDTLTLFCTVYDEMLDDDNEIRQIITDMTGVEVIESYLSGMMADEAIQSIMASGNFPDMIFCGDSESCQDMYEVGMLVPWDDYLADPAYSNIRDLYTDAEWELFRQNDGHIYWCNSLSSQYGEPKDTSFNECAFWIQVRVLEWAGYPLIETLDDYFDLLEAYYEANPVNEDGTDVIPYTMIHDDWRIFGLDLAPRMLMGYAYNDTAIIDLSSGAPQIIDYNTSSVAKEYFEKLNKAYNDGLIDPNFKFQSYDEYVGKISSGAVLGFFDFWWDSVVNTESYFPYNGMSDLGYDYVPLFLTIDADTEKKAVEPRLINNAGFCITTSCMDPDQAFTFINRILDQDIHDLRFWGIEGEDYYIDSDGLYYRDDQQIMNWKNTNYKLSHVCSYQYMPNFYGTSRDGINAMRPEQQPSIYQAGLSAPLLNCLKAYGCETISDLFYYGECNRSTTLMPPLYICANSLTYNGLPGKSLQAINELKHSMLPDLVTCKPNDFKAAWDHYLDGYAQCDPDSLFTELLNYATDNYNKYGG